MPRYLIEVEHDSGATSCGTVVRMFLDTGSHYLSHADWGCEDGVHKCWLIVETESREQAKAVVPPFMRQHAKIIRLNRFFSDEMGKILTSHREDG